MSEVFVVNHFRNIMYVFKKKTTKKIQITSMSDTIFRSIIHFKCKSFTILSFRKDIYIVYEKD